MIKLSVFENVWYDTIRYDEEFNVDWKTECGQLKLQHT